LPNLREHFEALPEGVLREGFLFCLRDELFGVSMSVIEITFDGKNFIYKRITAENEDDMPEDIETPTTNHAGGFAIGCVAGSLFWIALIFVIVAIMAR
jgi:hypothetical protein